MYVCIRRAVNVCMRLGQGGPKALADVVAAGLINNTDAIGKAAKEQKKKYEGPSTVYVCTYKCMYKCMYVCMYI